MAPTIVLISGANRGLGKGFLERYLARPNHIVIAANRNPEHPTSKALAELPTGPGSRLIVVKLDATVESDAAKAVIQLFAQGIDHLDIVIANAGVCYAFPKVADITTDELQGHLIPDLYGVIWLYQATAPLLRKGTNAKWVTLGSVAGKIMVAVNWITKRINGEEEKIASFVIHPGLADTDMAQVAIKGFANYGDKIPVKLMSLDESCDGMVKVIDEATKETHGGRFWSYAGAEESW